MAGTSSTLTVYHDGQFWVGVVEHVEDGVLSACRLVFGAEPSDEEIAEFVARKWHTLDLRGGEPAGNRAKPLAANPKRRQREAARAMHEHGASTKSQLALSQAREQMKAASKSEAARKRAEEKEARFTQKAEKRKEKHRGH